MPERRREQEDEGEVYEEPMEDEEAKDAHALGRKPPAAPPMLGVPPPRGAPPPAGGPLTLTLTLTLTLKA